MDPYKLLSKENKLRTARWQYGMYGRPLERGNSPRGAFGFFPTRKNKLRSMVLSPDNKERIIHAQRSMYGQPLVQGNSPLGAYAFPPNTGNEDQTTDLQIAEAERDALQKELNQLQLNYEESMLPPKKRRRMVETNRITSNENLNSKIQSVTRRLRNVENDVRKRKVGNTGGARRQYLRSKSVRTH